MYLILILILVLAALPAFLPPERVHATDPLVPDPRHLTARQERGRTKIPTQETAINQLFVYCITYQCKCILTIRCWVSQVSTIFITTAVKQICAYENPDILRQY